MPILKQSPTLFDFQKYVVELEKERSFSCQSVIDKCLLLGEEVGELFKAVRKSEGLSIDSNSTFTEISDELTDIFIYLCHCKQKEYRSGEYLSNKRRKKQITNLENQLNGYN